MVKDRFNSNNMSDFSHYTYLTNTRLPAQWVSYEEYLKTNPIPDTKTIVRIIVYVKNRSIILIENRCFSNTSKKSGFINFPGGHVKENESLLEACVRELKEELAIEVSPKRLISLGKKKTQHFYLLSYPEWSNYIINMDKISEDIGAIIELDIKKTLNLFNNKKCSINYFTINQIKTYPKQDTNTNLFSNNIKNTNDSNEMKSKKKKKKRTNNILGEKFVKDFEYLFNYFFGHMKI